jgi:hypothetical protein
MGLQSLIIPADKIDQSQFLVMLRIMQTYYLNVTALQFAADLKDKDCVILLHEKGQIRGFSTWKLTPFEIGDRQVNLIFSGDTIVEAEHWNSMALPIAWGHLMLETLARHADRDLYWLLTTKGYKTYRFLPVFFREFYPSPGRATPAFEKALLNKYAADKFGHLFNPLTGILSANDAAQKLVPGVADITDIRRKDPYVAFFERINPGHLRGDELVCLASCRPKNIRPFILRYLQS